MAKIKAKYVVPSGCGPLVDAIFQALKEGDPDSIEAIKHDIQEAAAWLEDVPDDTPLHQIDILTNNMFGSTARGEIEAALKSLRLKAKK